MTAKVSVTLSHSKGSGTSAIVSNGIDFNLVPESRARANALALRVPICVSCIRTLREEKEAVLACFALYGPPGWSKTPKKLDTLAGLSQVFFEASDQRVRFAVRSLNSTLSNDVRLIIRPSLQASRLPFLIWQQNTPGGIGCDFSSTNIK